MMLYPAIDKLMELQEIDSKYTLVAATAKRARYLQNNLDLDEESKPKYVRTALEEIANRKLKIVTRKDQKSEK